MKNSLRTLALTLAAAFVLTAGAGFAKESIHKGRFGADAKLEYKATTVGAVAQIEGETITFKDEKSGKEITLQVSDKTKIKDAKGDKLASSALSAGQRLEVVHRGEKVLRITVLS